MQKFGQKSVFCAHCITVNEKCTVNFWIHKTHTILTHEIYSFNDLLVFYCFYIGKYNKVTIQNRHL